MQRAKARRVGLNDLADLVRLWDGAECAPVQECLRSMVHEQHPAAGERLDELTQLASDPAAVGASIDDAACDAACACLQLGARPSTELPMAPERLIGAACTLSSKALLGLEQ